MSTSPPGPLPRHLHLSMMLAAHHKVQSCLSVLTEAKGHDGVLHPVMCQLLKGRLQENIVVVIRITRCFWGALVDESLSTEAVQGPALPLEGVHHVEGRHSLAAGVLGVGDSITDDVLQEDLENSTGLLVDEA